jgi:hypothetical protein
VKIYIRVERETDGTIRDIEYSLADNLSTPNVVSESVKAGVLFQSLYNEVKDFPLPKPKCKGFAWIGQALDHCDSCGAPIWEHDFLQEVDRSKPLFGKDGPNWVYKPITEAAKNRHRKDYGR